MSSAATQCKIHFSTFCHGVHILHAPRSLKKQGDPLARWELSTLTQTFYSGRKVSVTPGSIYCSAESGVVLD